MMPNADAGWGVWVIYIIVAAIVLWIAQWFNRRSSITPGASTADKSPIVVKAYKGNAEQTALDFHAHAVDMAKQGYFPISQSYTPGAYSCGEFLVALLLCVVLIGIVIFLYMLVVKPAGTLQVTYELRVRTTPPAVLPPVPIVGGEKTCPRCAETVKRAARVCRYCNHEFPPESQESVI